MATGRLPIRRAIYSGRAADAIAAIPNHDETRRRAVAYVRAPWEPGAAGGKPKSPQLALGARREFAIQQALKAGNAVAEMHTTNRVAFNIGTRPLVAPASLGWRRSRLCRPRAGRRLQDRCSGSTLQHVKPLWLSTFCNENEPVTR